MSLHPEIFEVPFGSRHDLIRWLNPCLPTCIALYRRVQFGNFTSTSRLFSSVDLAGLKRRNTDCDPWIIAFVDRSRRPETEVWVAASWEHSTPAGDSWVRQAEALVKALIQEIGKLNVSDENATAAASPGHNLTSAGSGAVDRDHYQRHMDSKGVVLFGAVHESTVKILEKLGFLDPEFVGSDIPYRKYIFDLKKANNVPHSLPHSFVYGKVDPSHYPLVKSRTQIPRQDRTLCVLPSVAIYPAGTQTTTLTPVAWSFLGLDASLTTLHVEAEYRGLGLAKSSTLKLFSEDMKTYWQHNPIPSGTEEDNILDDKYAHADVATDNKASQGVCESLGGIWSFLVFWVRVNVNTV